MKKVMYSSFDFQTFKDFAHFTGNLKNLLKV
jgi:hypothetical protein